MIGWFQVVCEGMCMCVYVVCVCVREKDDRVVSSRLRGCVYEVYVCVSVCMCVYKVCVCERERKRSREI